MEQAADSGLEQTMIPIIHNYLYPHDQYTTIHYSIASYKVYRFVFYQRRAHEEGESDKERRRHTWAEGSDWEEILEELILIQSWVNTMAGSTPTMPPETLKSIAYKHSPPWGRSTKINRQRNTWAYLRSDLVDASRQSTHAQRLAPPDYWLRELQRKIWSKLLGICSCCWTIPCFVR